MDLSQFKGGECFPLWSYVHAQIPGTIFTLVLLIWLSQKQLVPGETDGWMNSVFGHLFALSRLKTTWAIEMNLEWNIAPVQYQSLDPPHCSPPSYKYASGCPRPLETFDLKLWTFPNSGAGSASHNDHLPTISHHPRSPHHLEERWNYSSKQETNSESRQRSQTSHTHSNPLKMSLAYHVFKSYELCVSTSRSPTVCLPRQKNHWRCHKHSPPSHNPPSWQKDTHVRAIPLHWLQFGV